MSKQSTLFESWASKGANKKNTSASISDVVDLCDSDDDALLAAVLEESIKDQGGASSTDNENLHRPSTSAPKAEHTWSRVKANKDMQGAKNENAVYAQRGVPSKDMNLYGTFDPSDFDGEFDQIADINATNIENLPGFDKTSGNMWIYPTNYPVREYQYNIVAKALYENTLVVLPTGLGKTFIAAVLMYNFYRWYPRGKVVFMAPTKPLVAQQIEACYNIMGIPQADTAEMTGAMLPPERKKAWMAKRVFFLTPQVMSNDLSRGAFPALDVKCLVVDEAHKATGNHAYCQVVKELIQHGNQFRILALSATPGNDLKAVQQVLNNLLVSGIELRHEESLDIRAYQHDRKVEKIVVKLGEQLNGVKNQYLKVINVVVTRLKRRGVLSNRDPKSFSKYQILMAKEEFAKNPPLNMPVDQRGVTHADFGLCISLYHGYELLEKHGLRSLYSHLEALLSGEKGSASSRHELQRNNNVTELMDMLRSTFQPIKNTVPCSQMASPTASQKAKPFAVGHPKMEKLQDIVLEHFKRFMRDQGTNDKEVKTRIMIFAQYRDSVNEITELLNRHRPLVRAMSFIGQSSAGKTSKGFTQKEQLKVMKSFREGGYNTLISTCVGEEGLDIGEVDLIICFDAHKSPIRLVQRMGRTGRKREGRIVMLMAEGKEEQTYNQSQYQKRNIHKTILNKSNSLHYYRNNARMVPRGLTPVCHKMHISVNEQYQPASKTKSSTAQKSKATSAPGKKQPAKTKSDGFLNQDELTYWYVHQKVPEHEIHRLPDVPAPMISLKNDRAADYMDRLFRKQDSNAPLLTLNGWIPWQTRMQTSFKVSHSTAAKDFVDLMEFMDVQKAVGDEDNYGLEMDAYLDKGDILAPKQSNLSGIKRYCTPNTAPSTSRVSETTEPQHKTKRKLSDTKDEGDVQTAPQKKKRKGIPLPEFSSDEEAIDIDAELPNYDIGNTTGGSKESTTDVDDRIRAVSTSDVIDTSEKDASDGENSREAVLKGLDKFKSKKRTKTKRQNTSVGTKRIKAAKKDTSTESVNEGAVKDFDKPVITVIANDDLKDFEDAEHIENPPKASGPLLNSDSVKAECTDSDDSVIYDYGRNFTEINPKFTEKFPIFTHESALAQYIPRKKRDIVKVEPERVKTPPSSDEIQRTLDYLELTDRLSPVDMLDLIDQWEREKGDGHSLLPHYANSDFKKRNGTRERKLSISENPISLNLVSGRSAGDGVDIPDKGDVSMGLPDVPCDQFADICAMTFYGAGANQSKRAMSECIDTSVDSDVPHSLSNIKQDSTANHVKKACGREISDVMSYLQRVKANAMEQDKVNSEADVDNSTSVEFLFTRDGKLVDTTICLDSESDTGKGEIVPKDKDSSFSLHVSGDKADLNLETVVGFSTEAVADSGDEVSELNTESLEEFGVEEVVDLNTESDKDYSTRTPIPWGKSHSVRENSNDPFDDDGIDDSVFAAVQTPFSSKKTPRIQGMPSHLSPRPCDTSQITFTQALACVHDSSNSEGSQGFNPHDLQMSPKLNEGSSNTASEQSASPVFRLPENNQPALKKISVSSEENKSMDTSASKNSHVGEPTFDLGFDLSDDDDDDVIPPSPTAAGTQPFSQKSFRSSCSWSLQRMKSFDASLKEIIPELPDVSTENNDVFECDLDEESQSLLDNVEPLKTRIDSLRKSEQDFSENREYRDSPTTQQSRGINDRISSQISSQIKRHADPPVAVVTPTVSVPEGISVQDDKYTKNDYPNSPINYDHLVHDIPNFDEDFNDEVFKTQEVNPARRNMRKRFDNEAPTLHSLDQGDIETIDPTAFDDGMDDVTSPVKNVESDAGSDTTDDGNGSPVLTLSNKNKSVQGSDSDDDESLFPARKRKKKAQVLMSPESPHCRTQEVSKRSCEFKTPLLATKHMSVKAVVVSDDDSPFVMKAKRKLKPIPDDPFCSDDDDFKEEPKFKNVKAKLSDDFEEDSPVHRKARKLKSKRRRGGNMFIEEEAELSGDEMGSSDDSDGSDLDKMDDSFIYDQSQCSQQDPNVSVNMKAVYLKSIRSPAGVPGQFKLKYDYDRDMNVFSQRPNTEEYSEYLEDSFCVDSDYEESEYIGDDGNDTLMMMPPPKAKKKPKTSAATAKGRTRIVKTVDSSSEEEQENFSHLNKSKLNNSKVGNTKGSSRNRIKSSSTSTSDESLSAQKSVHGANVMKSNISSTGGEPDSPVVTGLTQALSLRERVRQRLALEASIRDDTSESSPPFTRLKPTEKQIPPQEAPRVSAKKENVKAAFSLTMEGFSDSDEDDFNKSAAQLAKPNQFSNTSRESIVTASAHSRMVMPPATTKKEETKTSKTSLKEVSREERIRLAKIKQDGFRKKHLGEQNQNTVLTTAEGPERSVSVRSGVQLSCLPDYATPPVNQHRHNKPVILVDTREISSSQDLLTALRFKHKMNTQVRSLGTCDYIVSNRMAVERKSMSDFTKGTNKEKLVHRIRTMLETFDRVAIIIERDRDKGQGSSKNFTCVSLMKSKYVEQTISWLSQVPNIKMFHTEDQLETAALIYDLNSQEQRKGSGIEVPVELSQEKEQMLQFYLRLPRMSYILALNFLHSFANLKHFIHCPTTSIMKRFQLTKSRVEDMKAHLNRRFDEQMIPLKKQ